MPDTPEVIAVPSDLWGSIRSMLDRLSAWWERNEQTVTSFLEWAAASYPRAQLLEATGWLPHYTTPDLDLEHDADTADAMIAGYYEQHWPRVEAAFRAKLATWRIDEEARACFGEALSAHRHGLYRIAPRLLFPEIERLARDELGDVLEVNAGQRGLRHAASDLGGANFVRTGVFSLRLFGAFADRVYAKAKTDEELERVRLDPVPNRHAALHGLATYNTQKSSLNALIIAEFALLTIDEIKCDRAVSTKAGGAAVAGEGGLEAAFGAAWTGVVAGAQGWTRSSPLIEPQGLSGADEELEPGSVQIVKLSD